MTAPRKSRGARGEDDRAVAADREAKSYGEENTFERDVRDRDTITAAITAHSESVARRLRHDALEGKTITLKAKLARARKMRVSRMPSGIGATQSTPGNMEPSYPLLTRSKTLAQGTNDAAVIRKTAIALWDAANVEEPIRLLGVSVSSLAASNAQLGLFSDAPDERHGKLGAAMDAITARFGSGAISRAVDTPEKVTPSMRKKRGGT